MEKETIKESPKEMSESIKLIKNSRGYGWELRIHFKDSDEIDVDKEVIDRIEKLNNQMIERFDNGSE